MPSCLAPDCNNRSEGDKERGVSSHNLPVKNESLAKKWLDQSRRDTTAELISSNLLYSIEGQKYGMLCHYQLRLPLVYPPSKESFLISSVNCMKRPTLLCLYSLTTVS